MAQAMPIIRPLEAWLSSRIISNLTDDRVRYESSLYGPINGLLCHVFPLQRRFMVKPQAKLRAPPEEQETIGRVSIDSMNNIMVSRQVPEGKREQGIQEPDFIIVKAGPNYGDDIPLVVVEIKRADTALQDDMEQLEQYIRRLRMMGCPDSLKGFLIAKMVTYEFQVPPADQAEDGLIFVQQYDTIQHIKMLLEAVVMAHW